MNTKTILSILVLIGGLLVASSVQAEVAISEDGVTFPDDSAQYTGVPNDCPHSDSIVWDTDTERWLCESELPPTTYAIGNNGPAGGIVFYVTLDGLHGLEAALGDQSTGAAWGCTGTEIVGADRTYVGSGKANTLDILDISSGCSEEGIAARVADIYVQNVYDDWCLPSKDELHLMFQEKDTIGGLVSDWYWSSSEDDGYAWGHDDAGPFRNAKGFPGGVRAVRAF